MKRLALILCCFALAFIGLRAHADLDPSIGIGDPNCSSQPLAVNEFSNVFTFSPVNGGGVLYFCNMSPAAWNTLDIVVPSSATVTEASISCNVIGTPAPFNPCEKSTIGGFIDLFFPAVTGRDCSGNACGIPIEFFMTVDLNNPCTTTTDTSCPAPSGDWPDVQFTLAANVDAGGALTVPEPGSVLLLGTGLTGLWGYRRRRRK